MEYFVQQTAIYIGYLGVIVVLIGVIDLAFKFVIHFFNFEYYSAKMRKSLMLYLGLSLDFFIAKDIISLSLQTRDYTDIIQIVSIIGVRIFLGYFIHLEEKMAGKDASQSK